MVVPNEGQARAAHQALGVQVWRLAAFEYGLENVGGQEGQAYDASHIGPGHSLITRDIRGAPRIHGELLKVGIEVAQSTVAKYIVKGRRPPSQTWMIFLRNHADGIASVGFLIVPTAAFKLLFGLVILRHDRRRLVHIAVTTSPTADWIARQITKAFPWDTAPKYLIRDRDGAYRPIFKRRLGAMGIRDRLTAPRSPWQNGRVERLIGSIRRECLDHMIVLGAAHLRRVLAAYADHYNRTRTHLSLNKDTSMARPILREGQIKLVPHLGSLHHSSVRIQYSEGAVTFRWR